VHVRGENRLDLQQRQTGVSEPTHQTPC
jgi:hypothetical protein